MLRRMKCLAVVFGVVILAAISLSPDAGADSRAHPLKGSFTGSGFTFAGRLSHLGRFTGQITSFTPSANGGSTTTTWTVRNGDTVSTSAVFTITGYDSSTGLYTFSQAITIAGGTGRFAQATGNANTTGETAADFSTYYGHIAGTIGY